MQLVGILLGVVSILTFLSGIAILCGSTKNERVRSTWFFLATIFATVWMVTIGIFLNAAPTAISYIDSIVKLTYMSSIFIDVALLGYITWKQKYGKIITLIFFIFGAVISTIIFVNPSLLYTEVVLTNIGNSLVTNIGPFYFTFISFFCLLVPTVMISLLQKIVKSTSKRIKKADLVLLIGFAISGTISLIFNLILPLWNWNFVWLGPIAISTTIICFYYAILRYRTLTLSSAWMKILSYIVIVASMALIYMVIFYLIFMALFKGSVPSTEVIVLNFIMILIVLILMPALNGVITSVFSLISGPKKTTETTKENHAD